MGRKRNAGPLHRLTAIEVQRAGDGDHVDGGGLLLHVTPAGASWVFRYTAPSGRRRAAGLGPVARGSRAAAGDSLTSARALAQQHRDLLQKGIDPLDARDERRQAAQAAEQAQRAAREAERWTLARCAREYHERVIEPTRKAKPSAQWIASLENHLGARPIWRRSIADISAPELLDVLCSIKPHERARNVGSDKPAETVRRIRQRLDVVWSWAIFHARATTNPAAAIRSLLRESQPKRSGKKEGLKALPYGEAAALLQRLRQVPGHAARALEFAILTAGRTREVICATWAEIDLDAAIWVVPGERMKSGEPHTVYLSAAALRVLRGQVGFDARWVFPSPMPASDGTNRPLSNMAMLLLLGRLGLRARTTVHGLCRSTFSTWANDTGAARPDVVEAALAHNEADKVRAAYNRAQFPDERRALLAKWADYLARPAAPVVELKGAELVAA